MGLETSADVTRFRSVSFQLVLRSFDRGAQR
jgi:hypothetical protein